MSRSVNAMSVTEILMTRSVNAMSVTEILMTRSVNVMSVTEIAMAVAEKRSALRVMRHSAHVIVAAGGKMCDFAPVGGSLALV
jgi:uridylate kinase